MKENCLSNAIKFYQLNFILVLFPNVCTLFAKFGLFHFFPNKSVRFFESVSNEIIDRRRQGLEVSFHCLSNLSFEVNLIFLFRKDTITFRTSLTTKTKNLKTKKKMKIRLIKRQRDMKKG